MEMNLSDMREYRCIAEVLIEVKLKPVLSGL